MRAAHYAPGLTYYLMLLLALGGVANALGVIVEVWQPREGGEFGTILWGVLGFVALGTLMLGWHRFTLRTDGLYVFDVRGRRRHRWETLGRPRTRDFVHGGKSSILTEMDGMRGGTDPQAFSHHVCDLRGRTLYHLGPWYPRRREMMREVRRRIREARREESNR